MTTFADFIVTISLVFLVLLLGITYAFGRHEHPDVYIGFGFLFFTIAIMAWIIL